MRRVRGIVVSMLLWAVPWTLVGLAIGVALTRMGVVWISPFPERLGVPGVLALIGATIGAINGLAFALLMMVAERKRTAETLSVGRVGLWGAIATGAVAALVFPPVIALAGAAVGFGAAAAMAYLARRSSTSVEG